MLPGCGWLSVENIGGGGAPNAEEGSMGPGIRSTKFGCGSNSHIITPTISAVTNCASHRNRKNFQ